MRWLIAFGHPVADDSQGPVGKFVDQFADSFYQPLFNPALDLLDVKDAGIETRILNRRLRRLPEVLPAHEVLHEGAGRAGLLAPPAP